MMVCLKEGAGERGSVHYPESKQTQQREAGIPMRVLREIQVRR